MDAPPIGRDHHGDGSTISTIQPARWGLHACIHEGPAGFGKSSRDRPPSTARRWSRVGPRQTGTAADGRSASPRPVSSASKVDRVGRRPTRRPAQQVALPGADAERADDLELGRRLDALGHDERAPAVGQVAQRPDDPRRLVAGGAALDERQVDLDDVEAQLAQQPQAGVAGTDVVGRDADAGDAAGLDGAAQPSMSSTASRSVSSRTIRRGSRPCGRSCAGTSGC